MTQDNHWRNMKQPRILIASFVHSQIIAQVEVIRNHPHLRENYLCIEQFSITGVFLLFCIQEEVTAEYDEEAF